MSFLQKFQKAYNEVFIDNVISIQTCDSRLCGYLKSPYNIEIPLMMLQGLYFAVLVQCHVEREPFCFKDKKFFVKVKPEFEKKIFVKILKDGLEYTDIVEKEIIEKFLFDLDNNIYPDVKLSEKFTFKSILNKEIVVFSEKGKLKTLKFTYYFITNSKEIPLFEFCRDEFSEWSQNVTSL